MSFEARHPFSKFLSWIAISYNINKVRREIWITQTIVVWRESNFTMTKNEDRDLSETSKKEKLSTFYHI